MCVMYLLALSIFFSSQVLGAEIDTTRLIKLVEDSLAERQDPILSQHPSAESTLLIDFEALVFDIFYSLNRQGKIDNKKYSLIEEGFRNLAPREFEKLKEERFDNFNALAWHPLAMIDIESFKNLLSALVPAPVLQKIEIDLKILGEDKVFDYALNIFYSFAQKKTFNSIIDLWINISKSQKAQELRSKSGCCVF